MIGRLTMSTELAKLLPTLRDLKRAEKLYVHRAPNIPALLARLTEHAAQELAGSWIQGVGYVEQTYIGGNLCYQR